jgi:sec-independent protein translocase protein TatC
MTDKIKDMQIWEHLEELRWTVFKIIGLLLLTTVISLFFINDILKLFYLPINIIKQNNPEIVVQTILTSPFDGVMIKMKTSFLIGLIAGFPFVLYFLWAFVKPGLQNNEKNAFTWICLFGTFSFVIGIVCSYLLIIPTISALIKLGIDTAENLWSLRDFISFEFYWMLGGGIIFELPLLMVILTKLNIIEVTVLKRIRPYYIVIAFVVAAIITPTTDPFTLCLVAIPMVLLYELGIFIASFHKKKNTN